MVKGMKMLSLSEIFGKRAAIIEEFFESGRDLSRTEIADGTGLSMKLVYDVVSDFLRKGVLTKTRTVGKAEFYKLDKSNPLVRKMAEYELMRLGKLEDKTELVQVE